MMASEIQVLEKMMRENEKITGYAIDGNIVKIFVEDEETAKMLYDVKVKGYTMQIVVVGRFQAL
ncbi:MAG: hypothetical protein QXE85_00130 [Nitrososphaerota archaeon]